MDTDYFTLTLPLFDFSKYGSTSFTLGVGGNVYGTNRNAKLWLGGVTTSVTSGWNSDMTEAPNVYLGPIAAVKDNTGKDGGSFDTPFTTVTVSGGKITFLTPEGGFGTKTYDLDSGIYSGAKGLTLSVGTCSWNDFVITPFYASKI